MNIFITGGTGYIGQALTRKISENASEVRLLVRDPGKAKVFARSNIHAVTGDINDFNIILAGMKGCNRVFHLCGFVKPWSKDPSVYHEINVRGSENIFRAALETGVDKVVFTSTAGTLGFSVDGNPVSEDTIKKPEFFNDYEKTKSQAEELALDFHKRGLPVVTVNPSRVYGPGPLSVSNSVTRILKLYRAGRWRIIPGNGTSIGNYVYIDDVVSGHLLAAEKGRGGERYLLGGENISFDEMFRIFGKVTGTPRRMIRLPAGIMRGTAGSMEFISKHTGMPPLITREWVNKYLSNWILSNQKAIDELGYCVTPFEEGVRKTMAWLESI